LRRTLCAVVFAAAALGPAAASAGPPAQKTFRLEAQNVSIRLPAGWGKTLQPDPEWQWHAVAPASAAHLYVNAIATQQGFSVVAPAYAAALDKPFAPGDPHWAFSSKPARVASLPALEIMFRYRNLTVEARPIQVATIYAFVRGGFFYVFDYVATPARVTSMRPVFARSIRSLRFLRPA
jgi:hypothetical protein